MAAGDVKVQHGASAAFTITLASLATSSTRVAGQESTAVQVSTLQPVVDVLVSGKIRTGTSPTVNTLIDIWVYGSLSDTPTYPDTITGSNAARTLTSENVRNSGLRLLHSIIIDNTSDRDYSITPRGIAQLFGGQLPKYFGLFVTHNTAVNLNSTGGNHVLTYTPVYANVAQS